MSALLKTKRLLSTSITRSGYEDPELYRLLDLKPWDKKDRLKFDENAVYEIVRNNPGCVKVQYKFTRNGNSFRYPLYNVISLGGTLRLIKLIIKAHPEAIKEVGGRGTPLHAACAYKQPLEVVQYLYKKHPAAIKSRNRNGYLPLHNACEHNAPPDVIGMLVDEYPEALHEKNKVGMSPLMMVKKTSRPSLQILNILTGSKNVSRKERKNLSCNDMSESLHFSLDHSSDDDDHSIGKNDKTKKDSSRTLSTHATTGESSRSFSAIHE